MNGARGILHGIANRLGTGTGGLKLGPGLSHHGFHDLFHFGGGAGGVADFTDLLFQQAQHLLHGGGHLSHGGIGAVIALKHLLTVLLDLVSRADHRANNAIQIVDKAVGPTPQITGFIRHQFAGIQALFEVATALAQSVNDLGHLSESSGQASGPTHQKTPGAHGQCSSGREVDGPQGPVAPGVQCHIAAEHQ